VHSCKLIYIIYNT